MGVRTRGLLTRVVSHFPSPAMTRAALLVVFGLIGAGCGRDSPAGTNPIAPSAADPASISDLRIEGSRSFGAVGETGQLTATARWQNGAMRDVTAEVNWVSHDPSIVQVDARGRISTVGFGAGRIEVTYPLGGRTASASLQISVSPAGTYAVSGEAREPGQGPIADVRVLEPLSGRSTITDSSGKYTLAALSGTRLQFTRDGYEPAELEIAPDYTGYVRMQRTLRINLGETADVPKLTHMDVNWDVGADRCSPCRMLRIVAPRAGPVRFELSWDPNPGSRCTCGWAASASRAA